MKTTQEVIDESQAKVMQDLESKKLGNQPKPANEPKSLIHEAVSDATQSLDPRTGTIIDK